MKYNYVNNCLKYLFVICVMTGFFKYVYLKDPGYGNRMDRAN